MKQYKLDHIVREYMIESLAATKIDERYPRFLQIGISGLRDLNRDVNGLIKVKRITVDQANFVALLPNDYLVYRKIYVCYQGQQIALSLNNNMCYTEKDDCGNTTVCGSQVSDDISDGFFYPWSTNNPVDSYGVFTGRQYGVGGGNNAIGYYRIFENEGYLAIQNANIHFDEIIMEYVADITDIDGTTYVHPNDVEALKAWIYWKSIQRVANRSGLDKKEAERTYDKEKLKARKRHNSFNINDLMLAINSAYVSAPHVQ